MLYRIFVGSISSRGRAMIESYANEFIPEHIVEDLVLQGIKSKIKREGKQPDVGLIVLDEHLYSMCEGVASDTLSLPKVHRYINDDTLYEFLISKFGRKLDIVDSMLSGSEVPQSSGGIVCVTDSDEELLISDDSSDIEERVVELEKENKALQEVIDDLKNSSSIDDSIASYIEKISQLEKSLKVKEDELKASRNDDYVSLGKIAKAEQIMEELNTLKQDLKTARQTISRLEFDNSINAESIMSLENDKRVKDEEIVRLRGIEVESKELNNEVSELRATLGTTITERDDLQLKVSTLEETLTKLDEEVSNLQVMSADKGVLEDRVKELEPQLLKSTEDVALLRSKVDSLAKVEVELASSRLEIEKLGEKIADLTRLNSELSDTKNFLSSRVDSFTEENKSLVGRVEELESTLKSLESDKLDLERLVESFRSKDSELGNTLSEKDESLSKALLEISNKDNEISSLREELSKETERLTLALADSRKEVTSKEDILSSLHLQVSEINTALEEANRGISSRDTEISTLRSTLSDLEFKCKDAEQRLSAFATEDINSIIKEKDNLALTLVSTKEELVLARRNIAILEEKSKTLSETTVGRLDFNRLSEAKFRLENELSSALMRNKELESQLVSKDSGVQSTKDEYTRLTKELKELRVQLADRDITVAEKDTLIREITSNIFFDMAKTASPKVAMQLSVPTPINFLDNVVVVAGGSVGSVSEMYKFIVSEVAGGTGEFILVDLSSMSSIDSMLGLRKIVSPLEWLQGAKPIEALLVPSSKANIRVVSSAGSYIYEPYKLNVDWVTRLNELNSLGCKVVISLGCIDSAINGILYNSLSKCCMSYVVVASSPANLRGTILTLSGFRSITNTTVVCSTFAEPSKPLYSKLSSMVTTRIVKDSEVIGL